MKILILTQVFYPDYVAVAQQVADLAVDLARNGGEVAVLTSRRAYDNPQQVFPAVENLENIKIRRLYTTGLGKKSKWFRIIDAISYLLNLLRFLIFSEKFDVVIGLTTPPFLSVIGALFCHLKGGRFIYWIMDLNPEEAIEAGLFKKDSMMVSLLERLSRYCLHQSSAVIVLDRFMRRRIEGKGVDPQKIVTLPPWAHDQELENIPHPLNPFRKAYKLNDKFVIMYSGNHSLIHPLDTLLDAAQKLKEDRRYIFCFIGGGVGVKKVRAFKERYSLDQIIYFPYQPLQKLKYSLSAADLHVVVMGNPFVGIVHPCKIYGILAVGRPFVFIGPTESHIGDIIREERLGCQVGHGETEKLIYIIQQVARMKEEEKNDISLKSQNLVRRRFARNVLSPTLVSLVTGSPSVMSSDTKFAYNNKFEGKTT